MCSPCTNFADAPKTSLVRQFGKASGVPCLRVEANGDPTRTPLATNPGATDPRGEELPAEYQSVRRVSYLEQTLAARSGPDLHGFTAGPANDTTMRCAEQLSRKPAPTARTASRNACETLAGHSVTLGGRGKSKRSASRKSASASSIVAGVARTISPNDEMVGLGHVQAGVTKRIGELISVAPSSSTPDSASSSSGPCRLEPPVHVSAEQQQEHAILNGLLSELSPMIVGQKPAARRPFLAAFANHKKPAIERVLDIKISDAEWNNARKHAVWPGAFKPERKPRAGATFRSKVDPALLTKLAKFFEGPGVLQRYAYGEKILNLCGGLQLSALDNVDRLQKARTITVKFILSIDAELSAYEHDLPPDEERCRCCERDTMRRCMLRREHKADGSCTCCKFTPDGSLGRTTVLAMVNNFTGDDIKKLSGLDDTRVMKGRDNFNRAKRIVDELYTADVDAEEAVNLKKRIEDSELFYRTEFCAHVQSESDYSCSCFECGFHDSSGVECIVCPRRNDHRNSCNKCSDMYAIIETMQSKLEVANSCDDLSIERQEDLDQLSQDIEDTKSDLDEYRSHLARQVFEDRYDEEEIKNLPDDTVRITSDWKHKVLECYHRENMVKYFGKKGTSMIGFMLMWNSLDPSERAEGIKEVRFVMMFTDDGLQDEWAVACAKREIYENHLPDHIKNAIFVADGASCFNSKLHRAIQILWESWTGITETVFRITVAGGGKSALDGMFGRISSVLSTAVDAGMEYRDASSIVRAMGYAGAGLTATTVFVPAADRSSRLYCETTGSVDLESVLRTVLNPDGTLTAHRHSGIGGFRIETMAFGLYKSKDKKARSMKKKRYERLDTDHDNVCCHLAITIAEFAEEECEQFVHLLIARYFRASKLRELDPPSLKENAVHGDNVKSELRTTVVDNSGDSRATVVQKKRRGRAERQLIRNEEEVQEVRRVKAETGKLFLCDARCPITNRFCRKEFLSKEALCRHQSCREHDFPQGFSTETKLAMLISQPGGILAGGNLPDRLSKSSIVDCFELPINAPGSAAARCFGKFNRPKRKEAYFKPERLRLELNKLFNVRPVLTPQHAWLQLRAMREEDGTRTFSVSQAGSVRALAKGEVCEGCELNPCTGCRGRLISVGDIKSDFSSQARKRKASSVEEQPTKRNK